MDDWLCETYGKEDTRRNSKSYKRAKSDQPVIPGCKPKFKNPKKTEKSKFARDAGNLTDNSSTNLVLDSIIDSDNSRLTEWKSGYKTGEYRTKVITPKNTKSKPGKAYFRCWQTIFAEHGSAVRVTKNLWQTRLSTKIGVPYYPTYDTRPEEFTTTWRQRLRSQILGRSYGAMNKWSFFLATKYLKDVNFGLKNGKNNGNKNKKKSEPTFIHPDNTEFVKYRRGGPAYEGQHLRRNTNGLKIDNISQYRVINRLRHDRHFRLSYPEARAQDLGNNHYRFKPKPVSANLAKLTPLVQQARSKPHIHTIEEHLKLGGDESCIHCVYQL